MNVEKFKQKIHAYVALQNGEFRGATRPANEPNLHVEWKDDMEDWWRDMIMDGCVIVTVFNSEEYAKLVSGE